MIKLATDFSGIGAPEEALKKMGVEFKHVFACEIDKHARKSFEANHAPETFYNDITARDHNKTGDIDLYVAGFPCQSFSMAGKRQGFQDTRGTLFFNVLEYLHAKRPRFFVLENVKGLLSHDQGRTFQTILDCLGETINTQYHLMQYEDCLKYHVHYKVLNTKNFGIPQNRERVFIVGFRNESDSRGFRFPVGFPLKLKLKDILENEVDSKYFLSEKIIKGFLSHKERHAGRGNGFAFEPNDLNKPASCINAKEGQHQTDNYIKISEPTKKGYTEAKPGDSVNITQPGSETRRGRVGDQIANTLETNSNQGVVVPGENDKFWIADFRTDEGLRIRKDGNSPCLNASMKKPNEKLNRGNCVPFVGNKTKIRRLTPRECFRLQGFNDQFFNNCKAVNSDTQLYKQAGNSITVDVLYYLFKKVLKNEGTN